MFEKVFTWLFSEEERDTVSYMGIFFMIIIVSTGISLFVVAIDRYMQGWVGYLFQ